MIVPAISKTTSAIFYPESDGLPMAENSRQFEWIVLLADNLTALFHDRVDVLVSGNQFWYPVDGVPDIRLAPDVYVVFGRPKGHRSSYKQWEEGGIPMTVIFEILSPGNTYTEMVDKFLFYEDHGVEEYYVYDPDRNWLQGFVRRGDILRAHRPMNGFVSPRLGIRFDLSGPEMIVRYPDGKPFVPFEELASQRDHLVTEVDHLKSERDQAQQRAARLAELSAKLLRQQATPEELQELQRLSQTPP